MDGQTRQRLLLEWLRRDFSIAYIRITHASEKLLKSRYIVSGRLNDCLFD